MASRQGRHSVVLVERPRRSVAILADMSVASGRGVVKGIARYVRRHRGWSTYCEPRGFGQPYPAWLRSWDGHGVIASIANPGHLSLLRELGTPVVDVLGALPDSEFPVVRGDFPMSGRQVAEHLLERGFKHFGFLGIVRTNWSIEKRDAFVEVLRQRSFTCHLLLQEPASDESRSWEDEQDELARWVSALPKPVGVCVSHDPMGQNLSVACRRVGIAVPDDVAIVGTDNDEPICEVADPPLSSVEVDFNRIGYEAAAYLERLMAGEVPSEREVIVPMRGVVTRQSSDVLAIEDRRIAAAIRFIRDHACDGIGVRDVQRHVRMSPDRLRDAFREILGRSVHEEIVFVRLKRAMLLLAETDLSIAAVADQAGFRHQEYLGVLMRKHLKTTPAAYRKRFGRRG